MRTHIIHRGDNVRSIKYLFIPVTVICGLVLMLFSGMITDHAVDSYTELKENESAVCIVIDAGHGGVDGGAVSYTGVYESQINLEIALRLDDLLHLLGHQTRMIRTEDISVYTSGSSIAEKKISDLKERVRIIKSTDNAILVSIHQNSFTDGRYSGAQVFYTEKGQSLANITQSLFLSLLNPGSNRKIKSAKGIYLMEKIECVGILVECGFLSNFTEEYKLRTPSYQQKICSIIACALSQYINDVSVA